MRSTHQRPATASPPNDGYPEVIACALLAAGGSRRLGTPKQLVMYDGAPLINTALAACNGNGRVGIVIGGNADAVRAALSAGDHEYIVNDAWQEGIASSIRAAVDWARTIDAEALLLHLVDLPHIHFPELHALVLAYEGGAKLVGTEYENGVLGAPALFDARYYDELHALRGDRGAARILREREETVAIPFRGDPLDVDTPEDVQRLLASSPNATRR